MRDQPRIGAATPEADALEQRQPVAGPEVLTGRPYDEDDSPDTEALSHADEADVLEQQSEVDDDEDGYPHE